MGGATLGVGTINLLKSAAATNELAYECEGASYKACFHAKSYPKDIHVKSTNDGRPRRWGRTAYCAFRGY